MRAAAKNEKVISNNKIRKVSSAKKTFLDPRARRARFESPPSKVKMKTKVMPAGGGASGAEGVKEEIAEMRQEEAARDKVQAAEIEKMMGIQQEQANLENARVKAIEGELKELESKAPAKWKLDFIYLLAWIWDIIEIPIEALTMGFGDEIGDFVFLGIAYAMLGSQFFIKAFVKTKVKVFGKQTPIPIILAGFIPILDLTLNNKQAIEVIKNTAKATHAKTNELKKELKMSGK